MVIVDRQRIAARRFQLSGSDKKLHDTSRLDEGLVIMGVIDEFKKTKSKESFSDHSQHQKIYPPLALLHPG